MTSKLAVYNDALSHLGERSLSSLTEAGEARRRLDAVWDAVVLECLEAGQWNHASRTVEIDPSDTVEPLFGYTLAFVKPDDWLKTVVISGNERLDPPLQFYEDEGAYWFADIEPLYVRYVSQGTDYGLNTVIWSPAFAKYVGYALAMRTCKGISGASPPDWLRDDYKRSLQTARSRDAMNQPPGQTPQGTWVTARNNSNVRGSRWNGRWSD